MKAITQLLVLAVIAFAGTLPAGETSESGSPNDAITLKGKITCSKSELNDSPTCRTVLVVRDQQAGSNGNNGDNENDVVYYFDDAASKKYHKFVCEQGVNGTVVGFVSEKNGVKSIKVSKLAFKSEGNPK